jgi:hypothetical protein
VSSTLVSLEPTLTSTGNGTNSNSGSPVLRPIDTASNYGAPQASSPNAPNDKGPAHHDDYFAKAPRIPNGSTRSLPTTPHGSKGNITFSPRIQFHDAWSPQDYDRRGDVATCNRLTPMLAQQIKEELNTFKMVWSITLDCQSQANRNAGDGGPRTFQTTYALFLMIMHLSSGHGVLAIPSKFALVHWSKIIYELPCQLTIMFWLLRTSILASICSRVETNLLAGDEQAKQHL